MFSNGVTRPIAQVAIATFPNPDGLTAVNGDAFQVSQNSGTYTLEQPGAGGAGQIDPVDAGVVHRRPLLAADRPDHQPERLLGVLEDHHHR